MDGPAIRSLNSDGSHQISVSGQGVQGNEAAIPFKPQQRQPIISHTSSPWASRVIPIHSRHFDLREPIMIATPPARRHIVGAALRRYRQELGFGLDDAARLLECDRSKISRIETGQRGIRTKELRELLTEYGADKQV